jgi:hypothetical protein
MIFILPTSGRRIEDVQLFSPTNFAFGNLGQERAAFPFTEQRIDIAQQIFREGDVGAFMCHGAIPSMNWWITLHQACPLVNGIHIHT